MPQTRDTVSFDCDSTTPCEQTLCDTKRRALLGALAAGGSLALAGCTGAFATDNNTTEPDTEYDVDYVVQNQTLSVRESQTVLGAGLNAGLDIPYQCKAGFCGTCLSKANGDANELVNMVVNDFDPLVEEDVENGYFLPCTSQPRNHFKMDSSVSAADLQEYQEIKDGEEENGEGEGNGNGEEEGDGQQATFHSVTYVNEQWNIQVPEDKSLLVAGEEVGLDLPFQCRQGFCGRCLAQIDGDANDLVEMTTNDYDPLDQDAMSEGYTLTCTGQPREDFNLESGKYGELDG